jgi:DNA-directed RNA polymerase specialized sigma24 family protein
VTLVETAAKGDQDAWNALVDRFAPMVWAIARGYGLERDAAEAFHTTWLRLVDHLERIEGPERVAEWLTTTARRESVRLLRLAGHETSIGERPGLAG